MCRRNQLLGCALIALGFGMLVGIWIESELFCHLLAFFVVFLGITVCRKK